MTLFSFRRECYENPEKTVSASAGGCNARKPLSPSPVPEPLGRRTLDVRASIMLALIIVACPEI